MPFVPWLTYNISLLSLFDRPCSYSSCLLLFSRPDRLNVSGLMAPLLVTISHAFLRNIAPTATTVPAVSLVSLLGIVMTSARQVGFVSSNVRPALLPGYTKEAVPIAL